MLRTNSTYPLEVTLVIMILLLGNSPMSLPLWVSGMLCRNAAEEYAGGSKALNSKFAGGCTS